MKTEELFRWLRATVISLIFLALCLFYLYVPSKRMDLFYINKTMGYVAVLLAGMTLMIGPLVRGNARFVPLMTTRRHLGVMACVYGVIHFVLSLFFIPDRFPLSWYVPNWYSALFGLVALGIWAYLVYISRNSKITQMTSDVWKKHQQWGAWIAFAFIFMHLLHLKYEFWIEWVTRTTTIAVYKNNPWYIPANLIITVFIVVVVLFRLILKMKKKPTDTPQTTQS